MAITKITSPVLASNAAQDNLNAGSVIVFTKPLSATNTNITGNLTVTGTLSATLLEALSANITVIDIKQYELSGFNVQGNATVQGSVSATGNLTVNQRLNFAGDANGANNLYFLRNSSNNWSWGSNGVGDILGISGNIVTIGQDVIFSRAGITIRNMGESTGASLVGEATDVLAQRRIYSNAAQESRIYSTYTNASNYERFFIKTNVGATSATQIGLSAAGSGQNRDLEFVTGGSTRMTIASAGNVGIGTSTPTTKLEITTAGIGLDGIKLKRSDDERVAWLVDEGSGSGALYLFNGANSNSVFITGNGNSFLNGGNVGIGTGTPTAKLNILDTTLAGSAGLSGSALNIAQTWNTNLTPTALSVNVTDLSSNAASLLMDLQVGGVSKSRVTKSGTLVGGLTGPANPAVIAFPVNGSYSVGVWSPASYKIQFAMASSGLTAVADAYTGMQYEMTGGVLSWGLVSQDIVLCRDAANTLAQRNGLNPQEFRLYNKFNNASDYERFFIKTNVGATSATQIGLSAAGSGQNRDLAFVTGGSTKMTISSAGNVGIGTAIPGSGLHVSGALGTNTTTRDSAAALKLTNTSGVSWLLTSGVIGVMNSTFCIRQENTVLPALTITATTNNIGIGTNSPTEKLTVVGNISATGVVAAGSMVKFPTYSAGAPPTAAGNAGAMIYVSDDVDGPTMAFCNGSNWLRVRDNAIVTTAP